MGQALRTWSDLERKMRQRGERATQAFAAGTKEATILLYVRSRKNMKAEIYDKPIPKVKRTRGKDKGKTVAKWRRAGGAGLRGAERHRIVSPFEGHIFNDMNYALARHNLGLTAGDKHVIPPPPSKKRNTTREAPWRAQAIEQTGKARHKAYRKHLFNALNF